MKNVLLVAALSTAVLVPAASASRAQRVNLALVPLPKSALGAAARHLPIARDSGVVSNSEAASQATGDVTARQLKRLGRVTGYLLDYGDPFGSASGIREVQTEIDRYRSPAAARKGLEFWRRDEVKTPPLKKFGIHFSVKRQRLSGLPKPNWVYGGTISIKGLKPLQGVDAKFQHGPYLLDISISAGSISAGSRLVPTVARHLDRRLRLALAGHLRATPVQLPHPLRPGPPAHGPKPAALVLRTADLGKSAKVLHQGYAKPKGSFDENALSVYGLTMTSGGPFAFLSQEALVGGSKLEVQYFAAIVASGAAAGAGSGKATPVDLSGVGDNARGELLKVVINGQTAYEAAVVLVRGSYLDFVVAASASPLSAADVRNLAGLAAKRLNSGFAR